MPNSETRRCAFVISTTDTPCGVEAFARTMAKTLRQQDPDGPYEVVPVSGQWSALPLTLQRLAKANRIAFNLPMVAWKRTIVLPWILLLFAFITRRPIFLFLHEWSGLHPLRRFVFIPFALCSRTIVFLSPFIRDQFLSDRWAGWMNKKCRLALHAPTVRRPDSRRATEIVRRIQRRRGEHTLVIGHFGAIYKGKGTDAMLDVCAYLSRAKIDAVMVFIGDITKSLDGYENQFLDKISRLGLEDHVIVTGYIGDDEQLFAIFDHIGVFLYIFPEGLTVRRSSVLASVQSGRPVIVSTPISASELSHHEGYRTLIERGALVLFPPSVSTEDLAGYIMSAASKHGTDVTFLNFDEWWAAAARSATTILNSHSRQ